MNTLVLPITFVIFQILLALVVRQWIIRLERAIGKGEGGISLGGPTAILSAGRATKIAGWFVFIAALGVLSMSILATAGATGSTSISKMAIPLGIILGVTWAPWLILVWVYGAAFSVNYDGITRYSPLRKIATINWSEIEGVVFIPMVDMFSVRGRGRRFLVSPLLDNIQYFCRGVIDNVSKEKWKESRKLIEKGLKGPFRPDW